MGVPPFLLCRFCVPPDDSPGARPRRRGSGGRDGGAAGDAEGGRHGKKIRLDFAARTGEIAIRRGVDVHDELLLGTLSMPVPDGNY